MANHDGSEIETLVLRLYEPGNPQEIQRIESHLRDLQRSTEGWQMGDYLLGRDDTKVRFFGALTFQIKLNTGNSELDDSALLGVGQRLMHWLITSLNRGDSTVILRKLCSTLAFYNTIDREVKAEMCVKRVILSLAHSQPLDLHTEPLPDPLPAIKTLNDAQLTSLLWMLASLIEEATKVINIQDARIMSQISVRIEENLHDAISVMSYCFSPSKVYEGSSSGHGLQLEALSTLMAWAFFAQKSWPGKEENLRRLRELMDKVLEWFHMACVDEAADTFSELLSNFGSFFTSSQLEKLSDMLVGPWGQERIQELLLEPMDETPNFVRLLLAYGELSLKRLITSPEDSHSQQIVGQMHKLLESPGFAGVEDVVAVETLEFWNSFVEFVVDSEFEEPDEPKPWLEAANVHIMQTFQDLWKKIKLPTQEQFKELDSDKQKDFRQFRIDVRELLLAAYPALRSRLTQAIAQLCSDSLARQDWLEVEASLFCLNAISIAEQESEDHILARLFGSSLYVQLKEANTVIPARTRATGVDLLGQYADFFERHTEYLPSALDFLFASLQSPSLAQKSAKSINRLSSSCRSSLVQQLPNFVHAYEQFLGWPTSEVSTKEKVIGGIAAIIQALPSLTEQAEWLSTLMRLVQLDLDRARSELSNNLIEEAQVSALSALRCLASISKSSQAQSDEPLDDEIEVAAKSFWLKGRGVEIQNQVFGIIRNVLEIFNQSTQPLELHGDILEAVCNIFKSGFTESKPGPFVFSATAFVDFFSTVHLKTPRLEMVLSTTCSFLRSHSHTSSTDVMNEATRLLGEVARLINEIRDLREEADTTGLIEVMERFMPRYTSIFFAVPQEDLEKLLSFPLECLSLPEPLPKRAAAQFWAAFFSLTSARAKVPTEHLDSVINHFGPRLAQELIHNVAGGATRTDLDWFAEPLKKFSTRTILTRKFLEQALAGIDLGSSVGPDVKSRFLKQLNVANTIGTTKKVITGFWSQCKGISGGYAP